MVFVKGGCGHQGLERQKPGEMGEPDVRGEHHASLLDAVDKGASHLSLTVT